jgi:hypothetical protein
MRVALAAGLLAGQLSAAEPRYTLVDFGRHTQGVDLNAEGEVVYYDADTLQAFRYAGGRSAALPQPPDGAFLPIAMNDRGDIVGRTVRRAPDGARRRIAQFFIFSQGQLQELTVPDLPAGVTIGDVAGLDNAGVVAALTSERPARLCFVREGRVSALFDVAGLVGKHEFAVVEASRGDVGGTVVGYVSGSHTEKFPTHSAVTTDILRGFVATERGVTDLGDFLPFAASAGGRLIGMQLQPGNAPPLERTNPRPAWREGGIVTEFDGPPVFAKSRFAAISPSGLVVGEGANVTGSGFLWIAEDRHAFLFADGTWRDLNELVSFDGGKKLKIFRAERINDRGQILCQAMGEGGFRSVLLTPIGPSPVAAR